MENKSNLTVSDELALRAISFVSMMKLNLEQRDEQNTITDEEVLILMEASSILSKFAEENHIS